MGDIESISVQRRPVGRPASDPAAVLRVMYRDEQGRRCTVFVAEIAAKYIDLVERALATRPPTEPAR